MKPIFRRTLLFAAALYLLLGLSPLVLRLAAAQPAQAAPAPAAPEADSAAAFRIYDEARAQVLTVPDLSLIHI